MKLLYCCFRAFKLLIFFYLGGVAALPSFAWALVIASCANALSSAPQWESLLLLGFGIAALFCGLLWFALVNILYFLLLKLLWAKPPAWSRITQGKRDFFLSYGIGAIACIPLALFIIAAGDRTVIVYDRNYWAEEVPLAAELIVRYWWLWFASVATLYSKFKK